MSSAVPDFENSKMTNNIALTSRAEYVWMPSEKEEKEIKEKEKQKCKQKITFDKIYGNVSKVQLLYRENKSFPGI